MIIIDVNNLNINIHMSMMTIQKMKNR